MTVWVTGTVLTSNPTLVAFAGIVTLLGTVATLASDSRVTTSSVETPVTNSTVPLLPAPPCTLLGVREIPSRGDARITNGAVTFVLAWSIAVIVMVSLIVTGLVLMTKPAVVSPGA